MTSATSDPVQEPHLVMFVKDALKEEVGVVVELRGGARRNLQPEHRDVLHSRRGRGTGLVHAGSRGKEVVLVELQVVVVTEPPQHGPGGLVAPSLDEEGVEEEEACTNTPQRLSRSPWSHAGAHTPAPLRVSPLLRSPSLRFFRTTFFTSSNARGSSGALKHVL